MSKYYRLGEKIEGEKIYFCFGAYAPRPPAKNDHRQRCALSLHGFAAVLRPLTRSLSHERREYDEIRCRSAVGAARDISLLKNKAHEGSHRSFQGYLRREAVCEIKTPMENIPVR